MLLAKEICLDAELGNDVHANREDMKHVNDQLLELFGDDDLMGASSFVGMVENPLQKVVDKSIWDAVVVQLRTQLAAARNEKIAELEKLQEQSVNSRSWGGKRSPFRGF
eukprot:CAMPEP_0195522284 /NCGR_PEP_ID=MMETSP0794_2-20130614/20295_1 /TAXON_ID=515487 /ORGANISM="Stephanopyxis turris, Strain CCMP 815" /LENGTH=108 /DNA_ID=CAMNT_0040652003 /DNA_START=104 /DNA_END=430 /DNA_ORIENTATION=-